MPKLKTGTIHTTVAGDAANTAAGITALDAVPYTEFRRMAGGFTPCTIPHAAVSAEVDGVSAMAAWREYLRLTQPEVAALMGITQAAYAQMEIEFKNRSLAGLLDS